MIQKLCPCFFFFFVVVVVVVVVLVAWRLKGSEPRRMGLRRSTCKPSMRGGSRTAWSAFPGMVGQQLAHALCICGTANARTSLRVKNNFEIRTHVPVAEEARAHLGR